MVQRVRVLFDGEVFKPEQPLDLEPNVRYQVTIEAVLDSDQRPEEDLPLQRYAVLARDLGVADLAAQHDHYLYGTPKR